MHKNGSFLCRLEIKFLIHTYNHIHTLVLCFSLRFYSCYLSIFTSHYISIHIYTCLSKAPSIPIHKNIFLCQSQFFIRSFLYLPLSICISWHMSFPLSLSARRMGGRTDGHVGGEERQGKGDTCSERQREGRDKVREYISIEIYRGR